jgi:ATP-dependent RNA helicase DHX37/DHR1
MVETSKLYMKGVCSIDCKWLPIYLSNQCAFDKPLISEADENYESYKPRYDESRDMIVCHRESTFGRVMWKIKPVEVEFPVTQDLYKWFARFFLEGIIFKNLKKYESVLLASSTTMLKSWAK